MVAAEGKIEQLESKISALEKQKSTLVEEKIRENLAHTNDTARMKRAHDEEKKQVQMGNYSQAAQIHMQSKDEEIEELTKDIKNMQNAAVQYQQEWIAKTQAWASSVGGDGAAGAGSGVQNQCRKNTPLGTTNIALNSEIQQNKWFWGLPGPVVGGKLVALAT